MTLPVAHTAAFVYPRLIALHVAQPPAADGGPAPALPNSLALTAEKLEPSGVYLLENGFEARIAFGKEAPRELIEALVGRFFCFNHGRKMESLIYGYTVLVFESLEFLTWLDRATLSCRRISLLCLVANMHMF